MNRKKISRRAFSGLSASAAAGALLSTGFSKDARASGPTPKYDYIDFHVHIGRLHIDHPGVTVDGLLRWMDDNHIEKAVVLPAVSPEAAM